MNETAWFQDRGLNERVAKEERRYWRNAILKVLAVILFFAGIGAVIDKAHAEAVFQGVGQGVTITIYNEPCKLEAVSNLPFRATWEENGKVTEGCIAPRPDAGLVVGYFADKAVALMPIDMFKRLTGA